MPESSLLAPGTPVALLHSKEQGIVLSVRGRGRYLVLIEGMEIELAREELIPQQRALSTKETDNNSANTTKALPPTLQLVYREQLLVAENGFSYDLQGYFYGDGAEHIQIKAGGSHSLRFGHLQARNIVAHLLFIGKPVPPPPVVLTYSLGSKVRQEVEGVLLPIDFLPIEKILPHDAVSPKNLLTAITPPMSRWPEVDLHLTALIPEPDSIDELQALDIQLQALDKALEKALLNQATGIIIVHGVGRGILKDNVHKRLKQHPRIRRFYADNSGKYGQGATRAELS